MTGASFLPPSSVLPPQEVPLVDLATMHAPIQHLLREKAVQVLDSYHYIGGPFVASFLERVRHMLHARHAIGASSGTDALLAALMASGIAPGDEVITTPFTFFATAGSIARLGATPRFVDIDPHTFNLDPKKIEAAITPRTRAILPVHLFGQMCDMRAIQAIAREHDLLVIEDAAQAILARRDGLEAGSAADMSCFSFFPTKNLGGAGDGGLVTCQDDALAERVRLVCKHGAEPKYVHKIIGANFRLDALQAALLEVKLDILPTWTARRQQNAAAYDLLLADLVETPRKAHQGDEHVYHHYCVLLEDRDRVQRELRERGVHSAVYYPRPLHLQECFAHLGYAPGDFPVAERTASRILALPVWPGLTDAQIAYVAQSLRECV